MSRSYRKSFRTTVCCYKTESIKSWKDGYNRSLRRTTKHLINKLDLDNIDEDETYFPSDPETDIKGGNLWDCGDGFAFYPDARKAADIRGEKHWHTVNK